MPGNEYQYYKVQCRGRGFIMYWIRNTITGAAVVNRRLYPLYFPTYKDAYCFVKHRSLNEHNYHIIQKGAIVSRETIEGNERK